MSIQITIIGLGQIGASMGLALSAHKNIHIIGHDKIQKSAQTAKEIGAVHEIKRNLPSSVVNSDIIVLSLPYSELQETLGYILEDLKEGSVILDTAPNKAKTQAWMQENLPAGRAYIGLAPVINPLYLYEEELGVKSAREDLFHDTVTMIAASPSAPADALQLVADFVELLGSKPLFSDLNEIDGIFAATHLLPQLTAAALLNTTVDAPGWDEARKFASRTYAEITRAILHQEGAEALTAASIANRETLSLRLDGLIASLREIQKSLREEDGETLNALLTRAEEGRALWMRERRNADWLNGGVKPDPVVPAGLGERLLGLKKKR